MECINTTCPNTGSIGVAQLMLTHLFSTINKAFCDLNPHFPVDQSTDIFQDDDQFDFIVVGAGSAGSVIANRLSEISDWKVLLIEEGGDPPIESAIPSLFNTILGSSYDWSFKVERSEKSCRSMVNHQCVWPRGKMLGGSSSMNAMLYIRGFRQDYNNWEKLGNPGWGYTDVLKYFKKLEKVHTSYSVEQFHGFSGNVDVQKYTPVTLRDDAVVQNSIRDAAEQTGLPYEEDFAATMTAGVIFPWGTVKDGVRASTAVAYLIPAANRTNLKIMKGVRVTKLLIKGKQVYGVQVNKNGVFKNITCTKEVILSAGVINSPQILMLSGIGPKEHLKSFAIPIVADLKVGYNVQDHIYVMNSFLKLNNGQKRPSEDDVFYKYLTRHTELGTVLNSMIFTNSSNATLDYPDIQFYFFNQPLHQRGSLLQTINFNTEVLTWLYKLRNMTDILLALPALLRPKSRGRILLRSANSSDPVKIVSGYLESPADIEVLIAALKYLDRLVNTEALKSVTQLTVPVKECDKFKPKSDAYYECQIRNLATTVYHPVGSCKMGPKSDSEAVVDSRLKVYKVKGLRVIDSSVMPKIVSGNTNIPTIMVAEKGADMIKQDHGRGNSTEI